jgi:hypothetical protein
MWFARWLHRIADWIEEQFGPEYDPYANEG